MKKIFFLLIATLIGFGSTKLTAQNIKDVDVIIEGLKEGAFNEHFASRGAHVTPPGISGTAWKGALKQFLPEVMQETAVLKEENLKLRKKKSCRKKKKGKRSKKNIRKEKRKAAL